MTNCGSRTRRSMRFRCEALEDRNLLSTLAVHPAALIEASKTKLVTEVFKGTSTGHFTEAAGHVSITGSGTVTSLGLVTGTGSYNIKRNGTSKTGTISNGVATFRDAAGDTLSVAYHGTSKYAGGMLTNSLTGTVTGGTGQFAGATGTYSSSGTSPYATSGTYQSSMTITVKVRK